MQDKHYTIRDIARELNLSKSTVSRALSNSHDISPETRKKVLDLVEKLDFEPNAVAAHLRQHRTLTIGVVIPSFRIPFYSTAICGIHEAASEAGYNVMICQNEESLQGEIENINSLIKSRVDGLIISFSKTTTQFDHVKKIHKKGFPVVLFNRVNDELHLPSVSVDDYLASYTATEYLISRGLKKIAYVSGPANLKLSQERKAGYLDALRKNDLTIRENLIMESDFSTGSGEIAAQVFLSMPVKPDAVYCVCDAVAFGVMKTLKASHINVPNEISVMGYTNEPVAELVDPPLTTVSQPIFEIGKTAAEVLIKKINGETFSEEQLNTKLGTSLIIRNSTI